MTRYTEEEIAAEEERFGGKLPDDLRQRYLDGMPEVVVLTAEDGEQTYFNTWGPSTTDTDTKGREYPTAGMTKDTDEVRDAAEELLGDDVMVAWAGEDTGDLAVVLRDGTLGWWCPHEGGEVSAIAEIDWDPDPELLESL
jgi:hypothetical protein